MFITVNYCPQKDKAILTVKSCWGSAISSFSTTADASSHCLYSIGSSKVNLIVLSVLMNPGVSVNPHSSLTRILFFKKSRQLKMARNRKKEGKKSHPQARSHVGGFGSMRINLESLLDLFPWHN